MILVSIPVKTNAPYTHIQRLFGNRLAHRLGRLLIAANGDLRLKALTLAPTGGQRHACRIVNDLRVNMSVRPKHAQSWSFPGAKHLLTNVILTP